MENNQNINQEKNQAREIETKLKNYTDTAGVTTKQLEAGLWYVERKPLFRKLIYGFLILISSISWSYFIYGYAYYIAKGMNEDEKLTRQLVATNSVGHDYVMQVSARQLSISPVKVLKSTGNKYDLYVKLDNDNDKWWAEFDYYFAAAGQQTPKTSGYILPSQSRRLLALAQDFTYEPSESQLILDNLRWHRIDAHKIPDWNAFYSNRLKIEVTDFKYTPANTSLVSERLNLNQLSFNAINRAAYNFWEVGFAILLYNGNQVVNVNYFTATDFMSGEKREISLSWPGSIGPVQRIEAVPEVNIMEDGIYIPMEGGAGEEK